jgi:hypothetical protein
VKLSPKYIKAETASTEMRVMPKIVFNQVDARRLFVAAASNP